MMCLGKVVKSTAGHDKNRFFCIVGISKDNVKLADGKLRTLEKPKTKNTKHIQNTSTVLDLSVVDTNKKLRAALRSFNGGMA